MFKHTGGTAPAEAPAAPPVTGDDELGAWRDLAHDLDRLVTAGYLIRLPGGHYDITPAGVAAVERAEKR